MTVLAQDRQDLLDVLIHEVRQPLNNAQAALNDAMMTLQQESRDPSSVVKIQGIIDHIVLTLSNAIIGASLLDRETQTRLMPTDLVAVCDLACSDIGFAWEERIDLHHDAPVIFADADPILVRLAVRNLLDNAINHSAAGRKVEVDIRIDEDRLAVVIAVANWPAAPFNPDPGLFERGVRGLARRGDGKGLGLYIVREVARLHHGEAEARSGADGRTIFELRLPG